MPDLFPVFLKLGQRKVVVVGGGRVALGKVRSLLSAGADVTVVAPRVSAELERAPVSIVKRPFRPQHLSGAWYVVAAATGEVNQRVRAAAEKRRLFVNVVDEPERATAYSGGVVRRGDVVVAVSTGGQTPALAALLREALAGLLPADVAQWAKLGRRERLRWRTARVPLYDRRPLLWQALDRLYRAPEGSHASEARP
jgi:uroporphyrin-III C-methyltransferase/precorrin-2 dehydrogenase/sirohydrochlorin ferrochelatase